MIEILEDLEAKYDLVPSRQVETGSQPVARLAILDDLEVKYGIQPSRQVETGSQLVASTGHATIKPTREELNG